MGSERYWEIDTARGIAVVSMIVFHLFFDLYYFTEMNVDPHADLLMILQRFTASTFLTLVGISLTLSYSKAKEELSERELLQKYVKRGVKIFSWGLLLTGLTCIFFPEDFIVFGILHLIGVSIIIGYFFVSYRLLNLILSLIIILVGLYLQSLTADTMFLLWLGIKTPAFSTLDYFPLLPWFGLILIGIYLGNTFYPEHERCFELPDLSVYLPIRSTSFLGRHSLKIYLLHQPVILAILYALGIIDLAPFI